MIGWWKELEEQAKQYTADSPGAANLITDLRHKGDQLIQQVESRMREEDGWLFVPFYSLLTLFDTHILLEWFVRRNPSPDHDPDKDENEQQECEREADEISEPIQHFIEVLTTAVNRWPTMDLGSVGSVLEADRKLN